MTRLQTARSLENNFYDSVGIEERTRSLDELIEALTGQQRHHEERLALVILSELADIQDIDDIRMRKVRQYRPFLLEQFERFGIWRPFERLDGYGTSSDCVECLEDDTHATAVDGRQLNTVT